MDKNEKSQSRILSRKKLIATHSDEIKQLLQNISHEHDVSICTVAKSLSSILAHISNLDDFDK